VGAGCVLGDRVSLRSGSVLGERVRCGDGSFIDNNKRIWNGIEIPGGDIVKSNLITYAGKPDAFIEAGAISGMANIDITPELCAGVGLAAAGCGMRVGVGSTGDAVCDMLKSALVSGLCSAGAQVTEIDVRFAAAAVYVAKSYMFNLTVFIESNKDTVNIRFFDRLGMPLSGEARRGIETRMLSGEARRCDINGIIKPKLVTGAGEAYAASLLRHGALRGFSAAVSGDSAASDTLRSVLVMSGCRIVPERSGVITLTVYEDGTALIVSDENGFVPERCQMPALIALAYFMSGERQLAVSGEAPNALEHIAAEFGGKILRLGRDGAAAEEKYAREAIMCDGIAAAVFLCEFLHKNKTRLGELRAKLPEFFTKSCEVMINHDRGRVMRAVSESCRYMHREADNGLKICADGGWVHLSPSETRQAIRITGEGMSQEIAEELCIEFCDKTRGIDNAI
jgi:mannose-1-phosphate guanylyltransferase/phosphomannomutase